MAIINIIKIEQPSQRVELFQEDLSDQLGSSNVVFTTTNEFSTNSLQVFLNGLNLRLNADFEEINNQGFRFINYNSNFITTINSTQATLAVKYFKKSTTEEESIAPAAFSAFIEEEPPVEIAAEPEPEVIYHEEDLSVQVQFGIDRVYLSRYFVQDSLTLTSSGNVLIRDIDYLESALDTVMIINKDKIINKNLVARYIIS
jgi:hypothetical protein